MRFSGANGSASRPTHADAPGGHSDSGTLGKRRSDTGIGRSGTTWPNAFWKGKRLPSGLCHL
eukprot:6503255-Alexandrium_andersonii.AAC.1